MVRSVKADRAPPVGRGKSATLPVRSLELRPDTLLRQQPPDGGVGDGMALSSTPEQNVLAVPEDRRPVWFRRVERPARSLLRGEKDLKLRPRPAHSDENRAVAALMDAMHHG